MQKKGFQYPPILPIVYYDGRSEWTAAQSMRDKVFMGEMFANYIPDFNYDVVELNKYSPEQLIAFDNAMAFVLLLDKALHSSDIVQMIERLRTEGFIDRLEHNSSDYLMEVLENILRAYMTNVGLSRKQIGYEADNFTNGRLNDMLAEFAENFQKEKDEERRIGRREGRREATLSTAKKLIMRGIPPITVSEVTDLSPEQIAELQKELETLRNDE